VHALGGGGWVDGWIREAFGVEMKESSLGSYEGGKGIEIPLEERLGCGNPGIWMGWEV